MTFITCSGIGDLTSSRPSSDCGEAKVVSEGTGYHEMRALKSPTSGRFRLEKDIDPTIRNIRRRVQYKRLPSPCRPWGIGRIDVDQYFDERRTTHKY